MAESDSVPIVAPPDYNVGHVLTQAAVAQKAIQPTPVYIIIKFK